VLHRYWLTAAETNGRKIREMRAEALSGTFEESFCLVVLAAGGMGIPGSEMIDSNFTICYDEIKAAGLSVWHGGT